VIAFRLSIQYSILQEKVFTLLMLGSLRITRPLYLEKLDIGVESLL